MENVKRMVEELKEYCKEHKYYCGCIAAKNEDSKPLHLIVSEPQIIVPMITTLLKQACKSAGISYADAAHYVYLSYLAEKKGGDEK